MPESDLIAAVRARDSQRVRALLQSGANVDLTDDHGWTPLSWAAAGGDLELVRELLGNGANALHTGNDQRTPYLIALAAGRADVARHLQQVERQQDGDVQRYSSGQDELRPYCRAYLLQDFRRFPAWEQGKSVEPASAGLEPLSDASLVFLHRDFTVTRSAWAGEQVVFQAVTDEWRRFCEDELDFHPPSDFDWLPEAATGGARGAPPAE